MINSLALSSEAPIYTVAKCLNELIVNKDIDDALEQIVEWLATSLQIDRCYIFESNTDGSPMLFKSFRHGREAGIREASVAGFEETLLSNNLFPELKNVLERKQSFKVSINNIISPQLKTLMEKTQLQSLFLT